MIFCSLLFRTCKDTMFCSPIAGLLGDIFLYAVIFFRVNEDCETEGSSQACCENIRRNLRVRIRKHQNTSHHTLKVWYLLHCLNKHTWRLVTHMFYVFLPCFFLIVEKKNLSMSVLLEKISAFKESTKHPLVLSLL